MLFCANQLLTSGISIPLRKPTTQIIKYSKTLDSEAIDLRNRRIKGEKPPSKVSANSTLNKPLAESFGSSIATVSAPKPRFAMYRPITVEYWDMVFPFSAASICPRTSSYTIEQSARVKIRLNL